MSTTETALTVHLVRPARHADDAFLARLRHELHDRFAIEHVTIQVEDPASLAPRRRRTCVQQATASAAIMELGDDPPGLRAASTAPPVTGIDETGLGPLG